MAVTLENLIGVNASYHHEHRVTESDVEKATRIQAVIESTRNDAAPQVGDIVQFTNRHGDYYPKAHVENVVDGKLIICEQPMEPFVTVRNNGISTNTSGGAWSAIPANLERVGKAQKSFLDWGHCGPCSNGAFRVYAQVNVWRYTEGHPEFTTETHDRYHVTHLDKPDTYGYTYLVSRSWSTPYKAFRTDADYRDWLESIGGVERDGAWPNTRIVWAKKK